MALLAGLAHAGRRPVPALTTEYLHYSGAFTFRTPAGWTVAAPPGNPDALDAAGDGVRVRFLYRDREQGFDSLHADCMLERLAGPMETNPRVKYEYDFLSGLVGDRRFLDSAFVVSYDQPIDKYTDWRQRNLTVVGAGQSLCIISYAPLPLWKKDPVTRALLDAVVGSIAFRAPPGASPVPHP